MRFIVHEGPVGRSASNYIARVDLAPFGMEGQIEQLWLKPANDDGSYDVACIPFFTYGLALGDTVLLADDDCVSEVLRTGGHRNLRLLFIPDLPTADLQQAADRVKAEILASGLLSEWSGERFVAVDIPKGIEAAGLIAVMEDLENKGQAFWEWSASQPFSARS
ncbi:DUF4265 domain-containing protein [Kitasatospora sp. NPDC056184]|uniref:DUF4265 domain-containing protein n=1 Tax=Kitasatospora sp. NPDC056184 TaxID=3345738 RepID=UPI0035E3347D